MNKKVCIQEGKLLFYVLILLFVVIIVFYLFYQYTFNKLNDENERSQVLINNKLDDLESTVKKSKNDIENYNNIPVNNGFNVLVNNSPKKLNALDRVYNPLRYPYKSDYFYDQSWYPNLNLPNQVIGCGGRNQPCVGGTQVPIYNRTTPVDISNNNIAPVYVSTRGPLGEPQQMGVLHKVNGSDSNDALPLFGRRRYPNDNKYDYYTLLGRYGSKVRVITKNKNYELGTNDIVFVEGTTSQYRTVLYETDYPQYIPYL
tara:strand:- start:1757 stop:2530 length:774 start_codon:yes stop_codon:yes gene_type:complete